MPDQIAENPERPSAQTLGEKCLEAALGAIGEKGVEQLSLRDIARRLGVSHQAPYKHFASRDDLLAEVIRRCLQDFATALQDSERDEEGERLPPRDAMLSLGQTYLGYALSKPLEYRLMFGTAWPSVARDRKLDKDARAAFDVLKARLGAIRPLSPAEALENDAMFVWSTMHGLASILQSEAMTYLGVEKAREEAMAHYVMGCVDQTLRSLGYDAPQPVGPSP